MARIIFRQGGQVELRDKDWRLISDTWRVADIDVDRVAGGVAVITLYGEHDLGSKAELDQKLALLVGAGERVIVDLSEVEYVDSSALNSVVHAAALARQEGLRLTLQFDPESKVARLLEITSLRDHLPCADSREEAIRIVRSSG
jgi:anti-anti-sigma factor